ncbi:Sugar transporter ERD6-like 5 [Linum perenne]
MGQLDYQQLETGFLRQPNDVAVTALVAVFGSMATGCAYGYSSPAESGVMAEMGMSVAQYSTFGSIMTIGGMLGSLVNGKMADLIGRRYTMWVSEVFFVASWFIIAFAKRLQFMITFGFSVVYLVGTVISWRALALVGAVPCLLQVFGIFFIPESPRWLAKVGRDKELEETLKYLREKGCDVSQEALDIKDHTKLLEGLSENSVFDLFQQKYANALVVVSGLMVLQEFGGTNAIAYYAASICDMAGVSSTIGTVSIAIIQIPATVTSVLLTDKLGRRPLLLISSFGLFLSTFLLGLAFMFQDLHSSGTVTGLLAYIGLMGLPISFSLGMAGLPSVVMSEVFPINIKGTAGSLVTFLNWSSSFIVTYSFNFVVLWNSAGTFFIFSGIWVLGIMFIGKFVPETKGKTLEELTHIVSEEEEEEEG